MASTALLRSATWTLAIAHSFPARNHLAALIEAPSFDEAWKGLGALVAIVLYLLPVRVQARALTALWSNCRGVLRTSALVLVVVHAVPALEHLPRFLSSGSWGDAWRGIGATLAVLWFLAPLRAQARIISRTRTLKVRTSP
jgi:hypothetical protein